MREETQKKIGRAIKLLQLFANGEKIEVAYSGGKDSDILLWLVRKSGIDFVARYKNTTIDQPGTIAHCKANGVEILQPKRTFLDIVRANGFPSRFARFCCKELKEYPTEYKKVATGVRKEESVKRAKLYKEPTQCHLGTEKVMPMLDFTTEDIAEIVKAEGIKLHPLYYDEDGSLHLERRLGCIGCPLASPNKRREQYLRYPKMLVAQMRATERYLDGCKERGKKTWFENAVDKFAFDLFYSGKMNIHDYNSRIKYDGEKDSFCNYFGITY